MKDATVTQARPEMAGFCTEKNICIYNHLPISLFYLGDDDILNM